MSRFHTWPGGVQVVQWIAESGADDQALALIKNGSAPTADAPSGQAGEAPSSEETFIILAHPAPLVGEAIPWIGPEAAAAAAAKQANFRTLAYVGAGGLLLWLLLR